MPIHRALVIAAHPDDEVLGCGGTIARLASEGVAVHIALLADGVGSRAKDAAAVMTSAELTARRAGAHNAARILNAKSVAFGDFPDNRMDSVDLLDIAQFIERLVEQHQPDTVFTHHAGDLNIDHRRVHQATVTACRPQPGHCVNTLLFFEVPSSTEWQTAGSDMPFVPNWFVNVSAHMDARRKALEAYAEEMRPWPHSRSYEALAHLAHWRGASVGVDAAEAFMLGRTVRI